MNTNQKVVNGVKKLSDFSGVVAMKDAFGDRAEMIEADAMRVACELSSDPMEDWMIVQVVGPEGVAALPCPTARKNQTFRTGKAGLSSSGIGIVSMFKAIRQARTGGWYRAQKDLLDKQEAALESYLPKHPEADIIRQLIAA